MERIGGITRFKECCFYWLYSMKYMCASERDRRRHIWMNSGCAHNISYVQCLHDIRFTPLSGCVYGEERSNRMECRGNSAVKKQTRMEQGESVCVGGWMSGYKTEGEGKGYVGRFS
jgi:hypothetical protein